jgi:site-specific recombinase XerD
MIKISLIEHRNENRIRIDSSLAPNIISKIKLINGRKWSKTLRSWHIPYTKAAYNELLKLVGKENISISSKKINNIKGQKEVVKETFLLIKKQNDNINNRSPQFINKETENGYKRKVVINKSLIVNELNSNILTAYVPYFMNNWIEIIKKINGRRWNTEEKHWELPYVEDTIQQLLQINSIHFNFKIRTNLPKSAIEIHPNKNRKSTSQKKAKPKLNVFQERAIMALEEALILERKSHVTIKCYRTHLIGLWLFYPNVLPSKITNVQIKKYLLHKIQQDKIKETTQGQILNSLVAFYKRVLKQDEKLENIMRPKKSKDLPNVLSKEEVTRFMKSIDNLKHKTIMLLIYSAGLRRSELKKLRRKDILFSRKCIFVKAAKGKKDRYVLLSDKIIKYLKPYLIEYQPKFWLFEGNNAGQYSESSMQSIFTKAKLNSGVNPYVTLHGLRHSFATHIVENNVPIHVVKELLGHSSIKTTEIYLHISDKFRRELKSPLDDLDL